MTPMSVSKTAGGANAANPFIGVIGPTVAIDVNLANLTNEEVDDFGYLKAGVPLTAGGALLATPAISTVAQGTNVGTGNGVIGAATGGYGQPGETITAVFSTTGATAVAAVNGTKSGYIGQLTVGTIFASPQLNVLVADGAADFTAADVITWVVTGGASGGLFGVTVEATKLVANNAGALTGTFSVTVATAGLINRDAAEDILGRAYTNEELAGFADSSGLQVTPT